MRFWVILSVEYPKVHYLEPLWPWLYLSLSSPLKIFDWIVITLFGKTLELDELQFSYQKHCSTTMCTWLVVESISYFTRNGSEIFSCFMDMKKAFDCVKHSLLFRKLMDRQVSPIFLRLLLYMYANQTAFR